MLFQKLKLNSFKFHTCTLRHFSLKLPKIQRLLFKVYFLNTMRTKLNVIYFTVSPTSFEHSWHNMLFVYHDSKSWQRILAKRSWSTIATYCNIVWRNMLRAFGHHVAMYCVVMLLGVVGSSLKMVKFEPTTPNMSQQVTTGWPNACNMLHPTMLQYVALACYDSLAGALLIFYPDSKALLPFTCKWASPQI